MNLYFFLDQGNFQTINDGKTFFLYLPSPGLCSLAGSARDAVNWGWVQPWPQDKGLPFRIQGWSRRSPGVPRPLVCPRHTPNQSPVSFPFVSLISHSVVSDALRPHGLQHARLPCPSPTPRVYSNSCPLSRWCHPTISSSIVPFSSCLQSFPASGCFQMSQFFTSDGQSIGVSASASVLPMNIQDWFPLRWTGWISLQSKGLSRVFSNTTVQKHQFFGAQLSSLYLSVIHCMILASAWSQEVVVVGWRINALSCHECQFYWTQLMSPKDLLCTLHKIIFLQWMS